MTGVASSGATGGLACTASNPGAGFILGAMGRTALCVTRESPGGIEEIEDALQALTVGHKTWQGIDESLADLVAYQGAQLAAIQEGLRWLVGTSLDETHEQALIEDEYGEVGRGARDVREWVERARARVVGHENDFFSTEDPIQDVYLKSWRGYSGSLPSLPATIVSMAPQGARDTLHGLAQQYVEVAELVALSETVRQLQAVTMECANLGGESCPEWGIQEQSPPLQPLCQSSPGHLLRDAAVQWNLVYAEIQALIVRTQSAIFLLVPISLILVHQSLSGAENGRYPKSGARSSDAPRGPPEKRQLLAIGQGKSRGDDR